MANADPQDNAYAALLAASSAAASKRAYRRGPPPTGLPAHLQLPALPDLPSLFADAPDNATPEARTNKINVARITSASLLYALKSDGYSKEILQPSERRELALLDEVRSEEQRRRKGVGRGTPSTDRSCLYCRLFFKAVYSEHRVPRALVVNHRAHVRTDFDPDTNISEAGISDYQVLVPEDVAVAMVGAFHPMRWPDNADEIFRHTDQAFEPTPGKLWQIPEPVTGNRRREIIEEWRRNPGAKHYLFEDVQMPWNGQVKSEIRNILKLSNFIDHAEDGLRKLEFRFALESCLESNFGIRLERGGLDIDGGRHVGQAERWPEKGSPRTLARLDVRDLAHLRLLIGIDSYLRIRDQFDGLPTEEEKQETLDVVVRKLNEAWGQRPWLVTISTSKRLRYTAPVDMPLALWTALTWMAPAQLFVFINRVVTEAHVQGSGFAPEGRSNGGDPHLGVNGGEPRIPPESDTRELRTAPSSIPVHSELRPSPRAEPKKKASL